ncbi:MAG TPA: TonB-dependent receptor [Bacteroidales bacterium]|nr:TonB-dependent receptor [Bacteroidales bacterium]HQL69620.1 TonB-dependent receptor [Bacteroidales bacterium]
MRGLFGLFSLLFGSLLLQAQNNNIIYIDEVEVVAAKQSNLLKNCPEIIRVVSRAEIDKFNYGSTGEILQHIAGVNIETGTGSGQPKRSTASLNGYPAQYTLVLVDGNRVLSDHVHTGQNLDLIPTESIERIEVITGAASAQYGSDAMAGVVNIITKSASSDTEALLYADGGSYHSYHGGLSLQIPVNKNVKVYSLTDWNESDGLPLLLPASRVGKMAYSHLSSIQRIAFRPTEKLELYLSSRLTKTNMLWQNLINPSHLFMPDAGLNYRIGSRAVVNAKLAYSNWYSKTNNEQNRLLRPELWINYTISEKNHLVAGTDFSASYFTRTSVLGHSRNDFGFYIQDEHRFNETLIAQASLRYDKVQHVAGVISPKLSVLYSPIQSIRLRAVAGRGFHAPGLMELYELGYGHGGTAYRFGNPDLKPEYNTNFSLGVEWNHADKLVAGITGFYSIIDNMIVPVYAGPWDQNPAVNVWMRQNILKANIATGEFSLRWQFMSNYGVFLNYTYSQNTHADASQQLPYQPGSSAGIRLFGVQHVSKKLSIEEYISVKAVHGRSAWNWKPATGASSDDPNGLITELADYQKLDAGISLQYDKRFEVFFNVYNILGQDIQNLDDALTQIDGEPWFNLGAKFRFSGTK